MFTAAFFIIAEHYAKGNKPETKGQRQNSTYIKYLKQANSWKQKVNI